MQITWNCAQKSCLFAPMYLFIQSLYQYGYGYLIIIQYYYIVQITTLVIGSSFTWLLYLFVSFFFLYLLVLQDAPDSSPLFPALILELEFPRSPGNLFFGAHLYLLFFFMLFHS